MNLGTPTRGRHPDQLSQAPGLAYWQHLSLSPGQKKKLAADWGPAFQDPAMLYPAKLLNLTAQPSSGQYNTYCNTVKKLQARTATQHDITLVRRWLEKGFYPAALALGHYYKKDEKALAQKYLHQYVHWTLKLPESERSPLLCQRACKAITSLKQMGEGGLDHLSLCLTPRKKRPSRPRIHSF